MTDIDLSALDRELEKGAAELLLLSVPEATPRTARDEFVEAVGLVTRGTHA
jgi:hypothetical protein